MTLNNVIPFPQRATGVVPNSNTGVLVNQPSDKDVHCNSTQQESSFGFNVQPYLPQGIKQSLLETGHGVYQIPHRIHEFIFRATETKVEILVFSCLIRFTLGFHRPCCSASLSFISTWTGIAVPNLRKGLESLISRRLVTRLRSGNNTHSSSIYEVPIVRGYLEYSETTKIRQDNSLNAISNSKEKEPQQGLKQSQNCNEIHQSSVMNFISKKENTNINKETKTLPLVPIPEYLNNYFSNLKPEQKRKRELSHFKSLKKDYNLADLSDAVKLLNEEGVPGTGAPCHSPMGFLAFSMETILSQVQAKREKLLRKQAQERTETERLKTEAQKEAEETAQLEEHRKLFEQTFSLPEQQEEFFRQFAARCPFFKKNKLALKTAAISEWASQLKR